VSYRSVVVVVDNGNAEVKYQSDDVEVSIFNLDEDNLYLYNDKYICQITRVNDDGTVDLSCVDTSDNAFNNQRFSNVPAGKLSYYSSNDDMVDEFEDPDDELVAL
jgi:hypothetical protein